MSKEWKKKFDEEFSSKIIPIPITKERVLEWQTERDKSIKNFISKVEQQAYGRGAMEATDVCNDNFIVVKQDTLKQVKELIESKRYEEAEKHQKKWYHQKRWCPRCEDKGYNYALDDLLKEIKEL